MKSLITLKIEEKLFKCIFTQVNWTSLFKENNELVNGIIMSFFSSVSSTAQIIGSEKKPYIVFRAPLNTSKFFIDLAI